MAGVTGAGARRAGGGPLDHEALTQFATIAQMRWRMFMNGLRSIHGPLDLGATGIAWMLYSFLGLAVGIGLFGAAYALASRALWQYLPILFWVISFLWLMFPLLVTSFQEQSDLKILLRFPVRFRSYFILHLISGLMEASTLVGALCCLGVWLGIIIARPDLYGWATLGLLVFAVFNVLMVRSILAWLDRWLAQRKTREILGAGLMVLVVGLALIPSVLNQKNQEVAKSPQKQAAPIHEALDQHAPLLKTTNLVQQWLPPGLGARTLQQAAEQKPVAGLASLGMLGLWAILAGAVLASRLKAQFRGQNLSGTTNRRKAIRRGGGWSLGGSRPFAGIVEKELRSLMRTVPLLWGISLPLLIVLVIAGAFRHGPSGHIKLFPYAYPLCVAYALLGFTGLFYNNLGAEGAGVQLLFLSPTPIRTVLLAKNLLHSILFFLVGFAAAGLVCIRLGVPSLAVLADTAAWLTFALPCNLAAGIVLSLAVPYRINPGRITRPAGAQANTLPAAFIQLVLLGAGLLVFWLSWSWKIPWLPVPIFLALAAGAFFVWMRILHYADHNANQRRDLLITTLMSAE